MYIQRKEDNDMQTYETIQNQLFSCSSPRSQPKLNKDSSDTEERIRGFELGLGQA